MNKLMQNISHLERHAYAPELNKIVFKSSAVIPAKGIKSLAAFKCLFKPANQGIKKRVIVDVIHSSKAHKGCDKVHCFGIPIGDYGYKTLKDNMAMIKERHNLPDAKISIKSITLVNI